MFAKSFYAVMCYTMTAKTNHNVKMTSFVYIGAKVFQLMLHYTSFETRDQNVFKKVGHKPSGVKMVKSHKISVVQGVQKES